MTHLAIDVLNPASHARARRQNNCQGDADYHV